MQQSIINIITEAYDSGLLQHDPMVICGLTVNITIRNRFNILQVQGGITGTVILHDSDSTELQHSDIAALVGDVLCFADNVYL